VEKIEMDNNNYYLLCSNFILKSSNYGVDWDTLFLKNYFNQLYAKNDTVICFDKGYFTNNAYKNNGLIYSIDNGISWVSPKNTIQNLKINDFAFSNNKIIIGTNEGFYISENFGTDWNRKLINSKIIEITAVNFINNKYIAGTINGEVFESTDLINWELIYNNSTIGIINDIFVNNDKYYFSSNPGIYEINNKVGLLNITSNSIIYELNYNEYNDKIFVSTISPGLLTIDNSNNWILVNDSLNKVKSNYLNFTISDSIILTYNPAYYIGNSVSVSFDSGKSFNENQVGINNRIINAFINEEKLFTIDNFGSLYFSQNKGIDWIKFQSELRFNTLKNFNKLILAATNSGIYYSESNGNHWNIFTNDDLIKNLNIIDITFYNKIIIANNGTNLFASYDSGINWEVIKFPKQINNINKTLVYKNNIFIITLDEFIYSTNLGKDWKSISNGISNLNFDKEFSEFIDLDLVEDNLFLTFLTYGLYTLPLSELGIEYTSVEKTEQRNYLYTFQPFPQPTKQEVKINTYWDSPLPFTVDDVEIYNLAGVKINTTNKLSINKETNYKGHIIWDTSGEQAGIYIVNIKHGTETRTQKIIVE